MTFLAAAAWSIALGLGTSVVLELTESARPGAAADLVNFTVCRVVAFSVFLFVMLRIYAPQSSIRAILGVRAVSPFAAVLALALGVLLAPGLSIIDDAIEKRFPVSTEDTDLLSQLLDVSSPRARLVLFVSFVAVIPLC